MKPNKNTNPDFHTSPAAKREGLRKTEVYNPHSFQNITVPSSMTYQKIQPPAYMWDRIAKVLDEQDLKKGKSQEQLYAFAQPDLKTAPGSKKIFIYAVLAVVTGAIILSVV